MRKPSTRQFLHRQVGPMRRPACLLPSHSARPPTITPNSRLSFLPRTPLPCSLAAATTNRFANSSLAPVFSFPFSDASAATTPLLLVCCPSPQARLETDERQEWTCRVYRSDAAMALGSTTLALLLMGQVVATIFSRCFCCGAMLRPGGAQACALILFLSSWYH